MPRSGIRLFPIPISKSIRGDATTLTPGTALNISVPLSDRVVQGFAIAPNPFTPNGDGTNDQTHIRFALGNLNAERTIQVLIFDLAGHLVWSGRRQSFGRAGIHLGWTRRRRSTRAAGGVSLQDRRRRRCGLCVPHQ